MCGFVGFTNLFKDFSTEDSIAIKEMTKSLAHRGPDEENFFTSTHTNLGHRRLIILDAKNGKQPMSCTYNNTTYTIVYNGQLYNANDIRKDLIDLGYEFNGYCDTEVILKAFVEYGTTIFNKFNGIFSFAIWNDSKKELTLVRDHFGIILLYFLLRLNQF